MTTDDTGAHVLAIIRRINSTLLDGRPDGIIRRAAALERRRVARDAAGDGAHVVIMNDRLRA